jgi:hypothetical protein
MFLGYFVFFVFGGALFLILAIVLNYGTYTEMTPEELEAEKQRKYRFPYNYVESAVIAIVVAIVLIVIVFNM